MSEHAGQVAGTYWNPGQYLRFSDHRLRPALELLGRIPLSSPRLVCDLGCGTGHVARLLAERWRSAKVHGIDNSREMLATASAESPDITWLEADAASWTPGEAVDLIFSNAALHWLPEHHELFPRLAGCVAPGGCLAVQMPLSWGAASHRLIRETLADGGGTGSPLGTVELRRAVQRKWVEGAQFYYDLLSRQARSLDIWETEYLQVLEGDDPVLEWVRATSLRPVLTALADEERGRFLEAYRQRLRAAYPRRPNGQTLYPFRRLFIVVLL